MKRPEKLYILTKMRKRIYGLFDDGQMFGALRLLPRYNLARRYFFPGEKEMTPGQLLDMYVQDRVFEASL